MSAKHTPGPWMLSQTKHESVVDSWHIDIGKHKIPLFPYKRIYSEDRTQSGLVTDAEHIADARLIAAAPELLSALLMVKDAAINMRGEDFNLTVDQWAKFHASIAKATGEAP